MKSTEKQPNGLSIMIAIFFLIPHLVYIFSGSRYDEYESRNRGAYRMRNFYSKSGDFYSYVNEFHNKNGRLPSSYRELADSPRFRNIIRAPGNVIMYMDHKNRVIKEFYSYSLTEKVIPFKDSWK